MIFEGRKLLFAEHTRNRPQKGRFERGLFGQRDAAPLTALMKGISENTVFLRKSHKGMQRPTLPRRLAQTCTKIPSLKASILRKCAPLGTATGGVPQKSWKFAFDNYDIETKCDKQISLRGAEISNDTRSSNQPSL